MGCILILHTPNSTGHLVSPCTHKYTLDPPERLSFSSSPPNSELFKSYYQIQKHACIFMCIASHACTFNSRSGNIVFIIHWILLSKFNFLHHPQILNCLKSIAKYRNMHARLCALHLHACTYHFHFFFIPI